VADSGRADHLTDLVVAQRVTDVVEEAFASTSGRVAGRSLARPSWGGADVILDRAPVGVERGV
jgi:hypothetical protein